MLSKDMIARIEAMKMRLAYEYVPVDFDQAGIYKFDTWKNTFEDNIRCLTKWLHHPGMTDEKFKPILDHVEVMLKVFRLMRHRKIYMSPWRWLKVEEKVICIWSNAKKAAEFEQGEI